MWPLSPQEQAWQGSLPRFLCSTAWFWSCSADLQQKPLKTIGNNLINRAAPSGNVHLAPLRAQQVPWLLLWDVLLGPTTSSKKKDLASTFAVQEPKSGLSHQELPLALVSAQESQV